MNDALPAEQQTDPPGPSSVSESAGRNGAETSAATSRRQADDDAAEARPARLTPLSAALRRARAESAEHSAAVAEVRAAEIARLELLLEALEPVLAQLPEACDIFDVAVSPGARPRLFIDQIGFIELEPDRRTYRFLQDTRHGRILLKSDANIDALIDAVTDYIAHRLIEREKALAIDYASAAAAGTLRETARPARTDACEVEDNWWWRAYLRAVEAIAALAFLGLLAAIAHWAFFTRPAG